jgi:serine/threonine protein phosphatase PrpC
MKLGMPQALNELGQRGNQEDSIYPRLGEANQSSRLFLVCDGMGGHDNGEVASGLVCSTFGAQLGDIDHEQFGVEAFESALDAAYDALDREDPNPDSMRKMGTTLTFLHLNDHEVVVAHMGDSRIYHVRPSAAEPILYQSNDHSLVNELVRAEIITAEEALTHPRRNVITRAMQPNLESRHKADVRKIDDVKAGDYFFMCSDGVLESVSNDALVEVLRRDVDDVQKIEAIRALCGASSHDNFSAYLVPIVEGLPEVVPEVVHAELADVSVAEAVESGVSREEFAASPGGGVPPKAKTNIGRIALFLGLGLLALAAVCATLYFAISNSQISVNIERSSTQMPYIEDNKPCDDVDRHTIITGVDPEDDSAEEDSTEGDVEQGAGEVVEDDQQQEMPEYKEGDGPVATKTTVSQGTLLNGM